MLHKVHWSCLCPIQFQSMDRFEPPLQIESVNLGTKQTGLHPVPGVTPGLEKLSSHGETTNPSHEFQPPAETHASDNVFNTRLRTRADNSFALPVHDV